MRALDRIKAHAAADRVRRIEVPEWGEPEVRSAAGEMVTPAAPLIIFYRMVTLDDLALVHELDGSVWQKQAARIVVLKSEDETGAKIFKMTDALTLRAEAAPDVVNRIAVAMLGRMSIEDAEKN